MELRHLYLANTISCMAENWTLKKSRSIETCCLCVHEMKHRLLSMQSGLGIVNITGVFTACICQSNLGEFLSVLLAMKAWPRLGR